MYKSSVTRNVYWLRDMSSEELLTQLTMRGIPANEVKQLITDAINGDGSAIYGAMTPVYVMIFATIGLEWDARIRES